MSHILNKVEDLSELEKFLERCIKDGFDKEFLVDYLEFAIPKDKNGNLLVHYSVSESLFRTAEFRPNNKTLYFSLEKIDNWLDVNTNLLAQAGNIDNQKLLRTFLAFFVISHEIEHSFQYLMSKDEIVSPCVLVKNGYKSLLDLFMSGKDILPRPIKETRKMMSLVLYKMHENEYILERNANLEAFSLVCQLTKLETNEQISKLFEKMLNIMFRAGYEKSCDGLLVETYKKILMYDKYLRFDKGNDLSMTDRIRYGLSIDEESRKNILGLKKTY